MTADLADISKTGERVAGALEGRGAVLFADEPNTLAQLFQKAVSKYDRPDSLNFKKDGKWRNISSKEMIFRAGNIALGLYSLGLRKGDRAAMLAANSPEWTLTDAGCQFAGIIDVPIYTTLSSHSVRYIVNDSGARLFFIQNREMHERLTGILGECRTLEKLVIFDADGVDAENVISLDDL